MKRILIQNIEIITMNQKNEILRGDILIEGNRIKKIAQHIEVEQVDEFINGTNKTVIPGFVQTHIHLCQTVFRGKGDDLELMDWLRKRIWPLEAAHDKESLYYSALLGIGELIQSGTTTIADMETVHHSEYAFQAIAQSGIRALSGKVMMDKGKDVPKALQEKTEQSLQESVDLLEKWHMYDEGRIQYSFAPRFVISCTEHLLKEVSQLSKQYGVRVHTHASENQEEIRIVEEETGMRNIVYLDHLGLANERLLLAHCVWLNEEEKRIIKNKGIHVSHCPGSNLKLASGYADVPEMLEREMSVSLGADGAPCNNNLDMFNEMRLAALIHKPAHGPTSMNAHEVFKMATIGGAKALGMDSQIGSIEVGKKADLVILDLNQFHTFPRYDVDPISRLVYSSTRADVETTIINGEIVMKNRVMKTIDKGNVLIEADKSIRRLIERIPHLAQKITPIK
ncbi:ethylammeline chlorohydrolase [Alkalihalobacillus alcalophilus ATCC 27647 = CGMCC 1.3604]|uniref:5-methylthioadenosine/S-adenosylhomocysteine deaminase n=1 Tax=Alkalihalobacillus alcalophilus ATCC 27647 = CGMCC 1.3604 TaxID=1218173 RepID=A0A094YYT6_ALKAL|nr:5'-deoxyadenosine deaminase [Alkalihalobacillus alcalophilus]KGA98707.1 N-ethylammeline chlorohydrolase [Alkalihalobacillus alcalophilus ATCC 27647 = CGMCC 1.3604]MED1560334.1 5'-deoxyadenosine deaminase [Alkalihalobacillus alcalophilus]THG89779.1 ethylammeline chlorohydrolase [Alkalihalobacillus alcalophilus ATCC 27647 = CGMCC 1.3604]